MGTNSCIISRSFAATSVLSNVAPVRFPSGLARFPTRPKSTGSPPVPKTMGTVRVAALAASVAVVLHKCKQWQPNSYNNDPLSHQLCPVLSVHAPPSAGGPRPMQKGNRGSDPRLLGLTMGTLLARTLGSDPVEQGSRLPEGRTSPQIKTSYWRPQWASRRADTRRRRHSAGRVQNSAVAAPLAFGKNGPGPPRRKGRSPRSGANPAHTGDASIKGVQGPSARAAACS
jgi:hypothetical protein